MSFRPPDQSMTSSNNQPSGGSSGSRSVKFFFFGDRRRKRVALFGSRLLRSETSSVSESSVASQSTTAVGSSASVSSVQDQQCSSRQEGILEMSRPLTSAAQAAAELGAVEALFMLAPHLRGQPPYEIFRAYQEARRAGGRTWSVMMQDLGITDESSPEAKRKAAQDVRDHPRYRDYVQARALRDAAVLAIAAEQKKYAGFIGQNPNVKIGFEADLRVALGESGVRQAEQKMRAVLAERYGFAGRSQNMPPDDDPTRLKPLFGRLAEVRPIQEGKGVVGTIIQDYGKGPIDFIAFGRAAHFLKSIKGSKVKVLGNPDEGNPLRFRIYFVFSLEKSDRHDQTR